MELIVQRCCIIFGSPIISGKCWEILTKPIELETVIYFIYLLYRSYFWVHLFQKLFPQEHCATFSSLFFPKSAQSIAAPLVSNDPFLAPKKNTKLPRSRGLSHTPAPKLGHFHRYSRRLHSYCILRHWKINMLGSLASSSKWQAGGGGHQRFSIFVEKLREKIPWFLQKSASFMTKNSSFLLFKVSEMS
jgi:hypothetical protein